MNVSQLQPLAEKIFTDIHELTRSDVGVTRASYGKGEDAAADYLRALAESEGLEVEVDRVANLVFRQPGAKSAPRVIWCGSHIDSVPQGGNYDGLAGVVAGLLCLIAAQRSGGGNFLPLEVLALRGEESAWFGKAYIGSSALLGKLTAADLALTHRETGRPLSEYLERSGADMAAIRSGESLLDQTRVSAYLELHIEQGPVLVEQKLPVGVVSGIRGNIRHLRVTCIGDAQHSGAVPRDLRHDAIFALADLIHRLDGKWGEVLQEGDDLVATVGVVNTDPAEHSISRIPGKVEFSIEARSNDIGSLTRFFDFIYDQCALLSRERGVQYEFDQRLVTAPAVMDDEVRTALEAACRQQDVPYIVMPSGAGHDAAGFANAGIPAGMLFIRNEHGSHNPYEAMDIVDFMAGTKVLMSAIQRLSSRARH